VQLRLRYESVLTNEKTGVSTPNTHFVTYSSRVCSKASNPGWRFRLSQGEFVAAPYTASYTEPGNRKDIEYTFYTIGQPVQRAVGVVSGDPALMTAGIVYPDTDTYAAIEQSARQKCIDKVMGYKPSIDSFPYVTEFKETVSLHRSIMDSYLGVFQSVIDLIRSRGFNAKAWRSLMADISGLWLAWSFAIKPTVADLTDLSQRLAEEQFPMFNHALKGGASTSWNGPSSSSSWTSNCWHDTYTIVTCDTSCSCEVKVFYKAYVGVNLMDDGRQKLLWESAAAFFDALHLSTTKGWISNLVEIIPFSWVAGYFFNIGDILSRDIEAMPTVNGCIKTTIYTTTYTSTLTAKNAISAPKSHIVNCSPGNYASKHRVMVREIVDLSLSPEFFSVPTGGIDGNFKKLSYLISVLFQLRR